MSHWIGSASSCPRCRWSRCSRRCRCPPGCATRDPSTRSVRARATGRSSTRHLAVALAERVSAGDQGDGLFVVHRHAREGDADVAGRAHRVAVGVRPLGVDVDQGLVRRGQRALQVVVRVAVLAVPAFVAADHLVGALDVVRVPDLGSPPGAVVGLPGVESSPGEAVRRQAHQLERAVSGQDHQVGPRQRVPVLVLDRLQEATGLVGVAVVPPAADGGEALHRGPRPAATVGDAVGAGGVPGHADHLRARSCRSPPATSRPRW